MPPASRQDLESLTREEIIFLVKIYGCKMLRGKLKMLKTKEKVIEYLKSCDCPAIQRIFGI
jgi:hypothetical protein